MAIREVLTSFTFEQQRQMINLIGTDIGDVSLLNTPTDVVVTAINEVINGDVDLSNQTIGMDDGTLASPSLFWDAGQGFYKVDSTKLALTSSLAITGDLEVDGDITFRAGSGSGGTLTFGDLDTDNIVFNADVQSSIVPDSTANYNLGTLQKQWNNLWIDGTASIDTLTVDENATIVGNLTVNSGNVYVPNTQTVVDLFDDYATTVEAFGAGTSIRIGDVSGTLTLRNPTIVGTQTSLSLFDTIAVNVNAFGAATDIIMGVTLGGGAGSNSNFTIRSDDTILVGDLNVNGGEILSSQNTFDLLINNTDVRIGAVNGVGNTVINNSLTVKENIDVSNSGTVISIKDNTAVSLSIREASNSYMTFNTTDGTERVIIHKDLYIVGNLDVTGSNTIINTTTLSVDDKNITLADTASPTDALADGGGITLKATTDKTITYDNANSAWVSNIDFNVTGRVFAGGSLTSNSGDLNFNLGGSRSFIDWDGTKARIGSLHGGGAGGGVGIYVNGGQTALFDTSGNLGVGVTPSYSGVFGGSQKVFHVGGTTAPSVRITSSDSGQGDLVLQAGNSGSDVQISNIAESGDVVIYTTPTGGSTTEQIRVKEDGQTTVRNTTIIRQATSLGNAAGSGVTLFDLGSSNRAYIARGFIVGFGSNADISFEITGVTGGTVTVLHSTTVAGSGSNLAFSSSGGIVTVTNGIYNANVYLTMVEYMPNDVTS